jgi:thiosulfate dehydrogenase [quinone] large subunit
MSQPTASSSASSYSNCEGVYAFLILRLFLGLRALFAGIEKWELGGEYAFSNYYATMGRMADGIAGASFIPAWMAKAFAYPLGYILLLLGVTILLGIKSRCSLFLMGLVYVALSFGLMAVQEGEGVAWLAVHVGLTVAALLLNRHNRFTLTKDRHD